jgi:hypothetical protein
LEWHKIYSEFLADISGIIAAENDEAPFKLAAKLNGREIHKYLMESGFNGKYLPGKPYYTEKMKFAILRHYLNLLKKKSTDSESMPPLEQLLGKSGPFKSQLDSLTEPFSKYTQEDNLALCAYLGAALFVVSRWRRSAQYRIVLDNVMERFRNFDPEGTFTYLESEKFAIRRMKEFRHRTSLIYHPFKDEALSLIAAAAWTSKRSESKRIGFIFDEGARLGYNDEQICNLSGYGILQWR